MSWALLTRNLELLTGSGFIQINLRKNKGSSARESKKDSPEENTTLEVRNEGLEGEQPESCISSVCLLVSLCRRCMESKSWDTHMAPEKRQGPPAADRERVLQEWPWLYVQLTLGVHPQFSPEKSCVVCVRPCRTHTFTALGPSRKWHHVPGHMCI